MGWKKDKRLKPCSSGCELSVCDQGRGCSTRQEEPMAEQAGNENTFSDLFRMSLGLQVFCNEAEADRIGEISVKLRYFQVLWIHSRNYHRSH